MPFSFLVYYLLTLRHIFEKMEDTKQEYKQVIANCRDIYVKKLHDYDAAWRVLRIPSLTDQIAIKAKRIRSVQETGVNLVDEDIRSEFMAIVNYGIIGLIQLEKGDTVEEDLNMDEAISLYDKYAESSMNLMLAKNHDYGEAWRSMRISSFVDIILMKINRTKKIENLAGKTYISEGIDANYMDMINYSVFALIKMDFGKDK